MATIHTYRSSPKSIQSIVIVLFLLLVAYIFFNGNGRKKKTKGSKSSAGEDLESGRHTSRSRRGSENSSDENGIDRENRRKREKRDRRKGKGGKSNSDAPSQTGGDRSSDDGKKKKKKKKDKKSKEWDKPPSEPPISAAPDHRTATPSKSAFRQRRPDDSLPPTPNTQNGNRIRWVDEENNLKSPVTKHFRKWGDFMGLTEDTNKGIFQNATQKEDKAGKKLPFPSRWSSEQIIRQQAENEQKGVATDEKLQIPENILQMMHQVEKISQAKPSDARLWELALQDSWDDDFGSLPKVAMTVMKELCRFIGRKEIAAIEAKMNQRVKKKAKFDKSRKFKNFVASLEVDQDTPEFPYKFILGWYLDTFRAKAYASRMIIDNKTTPMTTDSNIARASFILGWLEYIGELNKAQRLFVGWDLSGLTLRAQAMKENGTHYRLDVTIFLPCELEDPAEWAQRFQQSCMAFRHFHSEMVRQFNNTSNDFMDGSAFKRRRLIFRPGWITKGVDINKSSDPTPDQSVAQRTLIRRNPKVIDISSQNDVEGDSRLQGLMKYAGLDSTKKMMSQLAPGEVIFQDIRQFQWDKNSLTPRNNSLTPENFWLAYQIAGDRLQHEMEVDDTFLPRTMYDFIRSLDLGNYIPFHRIHSERKFLQINGFPALELLILSYIPLGQDGSTIDLILDPRFALTRELENDKKPTRHLDRQPIRLKLFIAISDIRLMENIQSDLDRFFATLANKYLKEGMRKSRIRDTIRGMVYRVLDNVYVVDESQASMAQEGRLPKGMRLGYEPNFPNELISDDTPDEGKNSNPFRSPITPTASAPYPPQSPYGSRPSPFLSHPSPGIQRPLAPGPQNGQGPFNPPPSPYIPNGTRTPTTRPPVQFTDPRRAEAAAEEARRRAQENAQLSPSAPAPAPGPPTASNYRPPSVADADDEEDEPLPQGRFGNLRNADGNVSRSGSGEKGPETLI
ncbi:hypothetical protein I204_06492 [Kwoniella mangroviensis CBS 8886]|uniref:uncharacterized protein n=1 Tax=Kwoniella mangroviensis CBS 8507 TaxID=1296122 RepID=UPI00080D6E6A|nr:uncharacterized protein I203_06630 [Kwoniella mangroviensis CBS 8507]OCF64448.1 hypothetical protein I203_06630 [Kwoniella mangroviensis CBS 8507]OCF73261.1 hypothetical protein I204_06492 [Kwoniella mangroviensis CBS 8886]